MKGDAGGNVLQDMVRFAASSAVASSIARRNSLSAEVKLVPLSDHIYVGHPRRAIIRRSAMTAELVLSDAATSKCIALVVRQVKIATYLF